MTGNNQYDAFAAEASSRFEEFVQWTIDNWPKKDSPLLPSDFDQARRDMKNHLSHKLSAQADAHAGTTQKEEQIQYLPVSPAPWP